MTWECPYCHQVFEFAKHQQKGAHLTNCSQNPKRDEIGDKISKARTVPRIEIVKDCKKCGKTFCQFKTEREIETNKDIADFCSKSCANSRPASDTQKKKVSRTMREKFERGELKAPQNRFGSPGGFIKARVREQRDCVVCRSQFECIPSSKQMACSKTCANKLISRTLKGSGKIGGYKTKSGTSKFHGAYYKGIWMDSSWEIALATRLDELKIEWERGANRFFPYVDIDGNPRKYYPDFYLPVHDLYLECKGYWTDKIRHKIADAQRRNSFRLTILESKKECESFNIQASK